MKLNELLFPGEYEGDPISPEITVSGIENDGRRTVSGCLFFCHRGDKYDSHALLPTLSGAGCAAAVVSREYANEKIGIPVIGVTDTRRAEAFAVSRFYGNPGTKLTLIGVTGTNGKTSVSTMLYRILSDAGIPCALIGTTGYRGAPENEAAFDAFHVGDAATMTTPPSLTLYPLLSAIAGAGITHVVMEVSSQALAKSRVAPLSFALSVFTNLSPEHLDYHRTMSAYLAAKKILFQQSETAVVNGDTPWSDLLLDGLSCRRVVAGTVEKCDASATDVRLCGEDGVSYTLKTREGDASVFVPIPGAFTVQNSLLALTAATSLGVGMQTAKEILAEMTAVPGRMERIDDGSLPFSVFIDYAHTEAALRSLLLSVRAFRRPGGRVVLLFGCGGDRDQKKRSEMGRAADELADYTVVTSDNSRSEDPIKIIRAVLSGMERKEKRRVIVNRERAIRYVILSAKPGDLILLVGKGHERYEIGANGIRPFDEKKIALQALEERLHGYTTEEAEREDSDRIAD